MIYKILPIIFLVFSVNLFAEDIETISFTDENYTPVGKVVLTFNEKDISVNTNNYKLFNTKKDKLIFSVKRLIVKKNIRLLSKKLKKIKIIEKNQIKKPKITKKKIIINGITIYESNKYYKKVHRYIKRIVRAQRPKKKKVEKEKEEKTTGFFD